MKLIYLQISIQREFFQLVEDLIYRLDMAFSLVLSVDKGVIQIYNAKDIKFFCKDFTDIALECCQSVGQSKKHYLILKVTVSGLESRFSLISLVNSYPVIGISEVKLVKLPSLSQLI